MLEAQNLEGMDPTFNWRCSTSSSLAVEYSALVKAVHDVASGNMHSPEGRQSIADACNSRKIGSEGSNGLLSTASNHGLSSSDCNRKEHQKQGKRSRILTYTIRNFAAQDIYFHTDTPHNTTIYKLTL
jgi:hypothetical protein